MEAAMGGPLGSYLVIGPFECFIVVAPVGILRCVGCPLLRQGGPFLSLPMCPWRLGPALVGTLRMGCRAWGFSFLAAIHVGFYNAHIPPVFVGRHPSICRSFGDCRVGGCLGIGHGEVHR
jgi:hypothetical protein